MPDSSAPADGIRLQAFLAHAGVASRRACEAIILDGRVSINGAVSSKLGVRVMPGDAVRLDGRPVGPEGRKRYILLNKPAGYLSAMSDPEGRPLAAELLKGVRERVYNVGRLDQWSSGLLLFTNDGEFASILVHPSGGVEKEYEIIADADLEDDFFTSISKRLRDGRRRISRLLAREDGTRVRSSRPRRGEEPRNTPRPGALRPQGQGAAKDQDRDIDHGRTGRGGFAGPRSRRDRGPSLLREGAAVIIAIDGPAGSGKSTIARMLAEGLGFAYVNSGSIYRAMTLRVLRQGVDAGMPRRSSPALDRRE